jgi:tRNA U38,U39,U40 pseudouridine synthase TruA
MGAATACGRLPTGYQRYALTLQYHGSSWVDFYPHDCLSVVDRIAAALRHLVGASHYTNLQLGTHTLPGMHVLANCAGVDLAPRRHALDQFWNREALRRAVNTLLRSSVAVTAPRGGRGRTLPRHDLRVTDVQPVPYDWDAVRHVRSRAYLARLRLPRDAALPDQLRDVLQRAARNLCVASDAGVWDWAVHSHVPDVSSGMCAMDPFFADDNDTGVVLFLRVDPAVEPKDVQRLVGLLQQVGTYQLDPERITEQLAVGPINNHVSHSDPQDLFLAHVEYDDHSRRLMR